MKEYWEYGMIDNWKGLDQQRPKNLGPFNLLAYGVRGVETALDQEMELSEYAGRAGANLLKDVILAGAAFNVSSELNDAIGRWDVQTNFVPPINFPFDLHNFLAIGDVPDAVKFVGASVLGAYGLVKAFQSFYDLGSPIALLATRVDRSTRR